MSMGIAGIIMKHIKRKGLKKNIKSKMKAFRIYAFLMCFHASYYNIINLKERKHIKKFFSLINLFLLLFVCFLYYFMEASYPS